MLPACFVAVRTSTQIFSLYETREEAAAVRKIDHACSVGCQAGRAKFATQKYNNTHAVPMLGAENYPLEAVCFTFSCPNFIYLAIAIYSDVN